MVRDITLGQYLPGKSVIHRLDARAKILMLLAMIVFIFVAGNFVSLSLMTLVSLLVVLLTRIPLTMYLKSMKVILLVVIFTGIINLFYGTGDVLWEWGIIRITQGGIHNAVFVTIRIITLVLISSVRPAPTTPATPRISPGYRLKEISRKPYPVSPCTSSTGFRFA